MCLSVVSLAAFGRQAELLIKFFIFCFVVVLFSLATVGMNRIPATQTERDGCTSCTCRCIPSMYVCIPLSLDRCLQELLAQYFLKAVGDFPDVDPWTWLVKYVRQCVTTHTLSLTHTHTHLLSRTRPRRSHRTRSDGWIDGWCNHSVCPHTDRSLPRVSVCVSVYPLCLSLISFRGPTWRSGGNPLGRYAMHVSLSLSVCVCVFVCDATSDTKGRLCLMR